MKIKTKEQYNNWLKDRKPSKRGALPLGKTKHRKVFKRRGKIRVAKPYKAIKILNIKDIIALKKKMKKLEKKYEKLENQTIEMARIEKAFLSIQAKLEPYTGGE